MSVRAKVTMTTGHSCLDHCNKPLALIYYTPVDAVSALMHSLLVFLVQFIPVLCMLVFQELRTMYACICPLMSASQEQQVCMYL